MRIIDLSHYITNETPPYPHSTVADFTKYRNYSVDGYTEYMLETNMHIGTHIDMPMHMTADGHYAGDYPPDRFMGEAVLLDVRGQERILVKPEYKNLVGKDSIVVFKTGFDAYFGEPEKYFTMHPEVDEELCAFLIEAGVKMAGMDMPSPDHMPFRVHRAMLEAGIFVLENLRMLGEFEHGERFTLIALPLKLKAEASLVRAVALPRADSEPRR